MPIEKVPESYREVVGSVPKFGRLPVFDVFDVLENMSKLKEEMNNFYTAIVNVSEGIIRQNEVDNLLDDEFHIFDFYKIKEKIEGFLCRYPLSENLCLKCSDMILKIHDEQQYIGGYPVGYSDFMDFYNKRLRKIKDVD